VAFQLVDDALDYAGDASVTGKTLYGDLKEGKLTLPLILALGHTPALVRDLTAARGGDELAALRLASAVMESEACGQVRRLAIAETEQALASLAVASPSLARDLLACVAQELTSRLG
jgi:octaprenyl-diphosphate synthase